MARLNETQVIAMTDQLNMVAAVQKLSESASPYHRCIAETYLRIQLSTLALLEPRARYERHERTITTITAMYGTPLAWSIGMLRHGQPRTYRLLVRRRIPGALRSRASACRLLEALKV